MSLTNAANADFTFPVRAYWEDTDTSVLSAWTVPQRVVTYGHAAINDTVFGSRASTL